MGGEGGREGRESDLSEFEFGALTLLFLFTYNQLRYLRVKYIGGLTGMLVSTKMVFIGMIREEEKEETRREAGSSNRKKATLRTDLYPSSSSASLSSALSLDRSFHNQSAMLVEC